MATAKPPGLGASEDSDEEQKQEHDEEGLVYADYRRAVQEYPSDNVGLDREFQTAYPSTTLSQFSALRREARLTRLLKQA